MSYASQIRRLRSDIDYLKHRISVNEADIERLDRAQRNIESDQDALRINQTQIDSPELGSGSWMGKHADKFLDRREIIHTEYGIIMNQKVNQLLSNIDEARRRLQEQITSWKNAISSKQSEINRLIQLMREENN